MSKNEKKSITSLKDLRAALDAPLTCAFAVDGLPVQLKVRRITSQIDEQRRAVVRAVTPPYVRERNDYDMLSPQYRAALTVAEDQARSLVVYHCCPEVAAANPGLTDPAAIHNHVRGLLPPMIQEMIALTALAGGLEAEVNAKANFTSTPGSAS